MSFPRLRSRFLFRILIPTLLCPVLAIAQSNKTGNIIGQVRVDRGNFTHPVLVSIDARSTPYTSAYSDNEGRFEFTDLPANPYQISIQDSDYEPVRITTMLNPEVQPTNIVNITLVPIRKKMEQAAGTKGSNPNMVDQAILAKSFPRDALRQYDEGVKASEKGKVDEAIQRFRKALEIAPGYYPAHNNLGLMYIQKGDYATAETEFKSVIGMQQADAYGYFNLGNLYLVTRRLTEALGSVQEGLRREPNQPFGLFVLGSIYERLGRPDDAERALLNALQADPTMAKVHLQLVNVYLRSNQPDKAEGELRLFIKEFPKDPMTPKAREVLARLTSPDSRR